MLAGKWTCACGTVNVPSAKACSHCRAVRPGPAVTQNFSSGQLMFVFLFVVFMVAVWVANR